MARSASRHSVPIRRFGDDRDMLVTEWNLENETIQVLKPLYRAVHDYFKEEGWKHPRSGDDVYEDLWWERQFGGGRDLNEKWAWWRLSKDENEYIRYLVIFDWQTLFTKSEKMMYRGKKAKGKVEQINLLIHAKFYLQFDIHDKFKSGLSAVAWKFKKVFFNRIYRQEIEQHRTDIYEFADKLQRLLKGLMALERQDDWPANQYGPLGYGKWYDDENMKIS